MKCVYVVDKLEVIVFLKNGKTIICNGHGGRWCYQYGEIPESTYEEYSNNAWEKLIEFAGYRNGFYGETTKFQKRVFLHYHCISDKRIYKDEVQKITIETIYKKVENPDIEYLQRDLGFMGYSELVFDREQELRKLMEG